MLRHPRSGSGNSVLCLNRFQTDGLTAPGGKVEGKLRVASDAGPGDLVGKGIHLPMRVSGISIDLGRVWHACGEEGKRHLQIAVLLVGDGADEPIVPASFPPGDDGVCTNLTAKQPRLLPVRWHIKDELEEVSLLRVVLRKIRCHLQRTVAGDVQCELLGDGSVDTVVLPVLGKRDLQDTGGEV